MEDSDEFIEDVESVEGMTREVDELIPNDTIGIEEEPTLLSIGYLSQLAEDVNTYEQNDQCIVPKRLWIAWTEKQVGEVLLVKIVQGEKTHTLCVGSYTTDSFDTVFLPQRCFLDFTITMNVQISVCKSMPPLATKIEIQPLDNELYHCDIAKAVSTYLSNWQILTKWTTLTVPCEELGGYLVDIFVKSIEPADTVLLRGDVPLELAEPIEHVHEWIQPSQGQGSKGQGQGSKGQGPQQEEDDEMYEDSMLDEYYPVSNPNTTNTANLKNSFIPFSGAGHKLGN